MKQFVTLFSLLLCLPASAATYTVTSLADTHSDSIPVLTSGEFRWAVNEAANNPGEDTIAFQLDPGTPAPYLILLQTPLAMTSPVYLSGVVMYAQADRIEFFPDPEEQMFSEVEDTTGGDELFFAESFSMMAAAASIPCENCAPSFAPAPGKYLVSVWVKEANAAPSVTTYPNAKLRVSFDTPSAYTVFAPSGRIIDGWQRIEGEIEIPDGTSSLNINLYTSTGDAYFDDLRFFPLNGSMKSYVYDPVTLRLMAELDERNYATFYEYDEEGQLTRVKKETEKGVLTGSENRINLRKQP